MLNKNIIQFIPILILDIISILSIIQVFFTKHIFTTGHYVGLLLLLFTTIIFFVYRKLYSTLLIFTLLLGIIGLASFSSYIISINFMFIEIRLLPLILLIFYLYVEKINLFKYIISYEDKKENSQHLKEMFIKKFDKMSDNEIEMKLNEPLIPEAIEALKEIKNKRKSEFK